MADPILRPAKEPPLQREFQQATGQALVKSADLVVGKAYFKVSYVDNDTVIPEVMPLVYLGRDLHADTAGLYFQDASSYLAGDRYERIDWPSVTQVDEDAGVRSSAEGVSVHVLPPGEYTSVLDFDKALNLLLLCSLRRAAWDGRVRNIPPPAAE